MTDGFVLIVPKDERCSGERTKLTSFFSKEGDCHRFDRAFLWVRPGTPVVFHARAGVAIIGSLFGSDDEPVRELAAGAALAIGADGGRYLIDHYWGGYAAIFWQARQVAALRDPSGALPVYHWRHPGCDIVFSDIATLRAAGLQLPGFDWPALAHRLRFPFLRIAGTGLSGISEIIPGQKLTLERGSANTSQLWSPWAYISPSHEHVATAVASVGRAVARSVKAWSGRFASIQLELSGGLDSSIVAACLATGSTPWRGVTYATAALDGDERRYARLVAQYTSTTLEEVAITADDVDPLYRSDRVRVRPGGFAAFGRFDSKLIAAFRASGADALFSGSGGDNVFCLTSSIAPVIDAWRQAGASAAWRALGDIAEVCETSLWDAASHTAGRFYRGESSRQLWPLNDAALGDNAKVAFAGHPWLNAPAKALPGKRAHVMSLLRILPFLDGYDRAFELPHIAPLMAQPVMEACLAVPTWQWITGGRDRAIARRAFAQRLPPEIVNRRTKGRLESVFAPAYNRSRDALRTLLVEGELATQGIIDIKAVNALIDRGAAGHDGTYVRVLELADVELWIRATDALRRIQS